MLVLRHAHTHTLNQIAPRAVSVLRHVVTSRSRSVCTLCSNYVPTTSRKGINNGLQQTTTFEYVKSESAGTVSWHITQIFIGPSYVMALGPPA